MIISFPNSYYTGAAKQVFGWESTSPSAKQYHKNSGIEHSEPSIPEENHESPSAKHSQEDTAMECSEPTIPNENPESPSAKQTCKDSEKKATATESITTITIIDAPHLQKKIG